MPAADIISQHSTGNQVKQKQCTEVEKNLQMIHLSIQNIKRNKSEGISYQNSIHYRSTRIYEKQEHCNSLAISCQIKCQSKKSQFNNHSKEKQKFCGLKNKFNKKCSEYVDEKTIKLK